MANIRWPEDREMAMRALDKFPDYAHSTKYQNLFQRSVNLAFGAEYQITYDLSNRMSFSCKACNKDMNSLKALTEHNNSGNHLKIVDRQKQLHRPNDRYSLATKYTRQSIQYLVLKSEINILGLEFMEQYETSCNSHKYYKCILCGAHGKVDAMYHHVTGSSHTDKYIKAKLKLNTNFLSVEEKGILRRRVFEKEGIDVELIRIIKGKDYYPYQWEAEGRPSRIKKEARSSPNWRNKKRGHERSLSRERDRKSPIHFHIKVKEEGKKNQPAKVKVEKDLVFKMEIPEADNSSTTPLHTEVAGGYRNPSPPPGPPQPIVTNSGTLVVIDRGIKMQDKMIQAFPVGAFEELCLKFNFFAKTAHLKFTDIKTPDDEILMIDLTFNIAKLIYYACKSQLANYCNDVKKENLKIHLNHIKKVMGKLHYIRDDFHTRHVLNPPRIRTK